MSDEQDKLKLSLEPPKLFGRKKKSDATGTAKRTSPAPATRRRPASADDESDVAPTEAPTEEPAEEPTEEVAEDTVTQELDTAEPAAEEPVVEEPVVEEPVVEEPVVEETVADQPTVHVDEPEPEPAPEPVADLTPEPEPEPAPAPAATPEPDPAPQATPQKAAEPAAKPAAATTKPTAKPAGKATAPKPAVKKPAVTTPAVTTPIEKTPAEKPVATKATTAARAAATKAGGAAKKAVRPRAKLAPDIEPEPVSFIDQEDAEIVARADEPPLLPAYPAAAVTGAAAGVAMIGLIMLSLRGCEALRGSSTCTGGPGFVLLVATFVACVLLGSALLKVFSIPDPGSSSFLGVGLVAVVALLFLIEVLEHWSMLIVIPIISVGAFLASVWVTKTFVEPGAPGSDASP